MTTLAPDRTLYRNPAARTWTCAPPSRDATRFHTRMPGYATTPLHDRPALAAEWGVHRVLVKDESSRLGLPAFKALGVAWAVERVLRERPAGELVAATDGNHGRALARFAHGRGIPARVFVPDVVPAPTVAAIRVEGATVTVVPAGYDETVRRAAAHAEAHPDAVLMQDTAWPGYERVPQWIVDGYATLLAEVDTQLGRAPSLVVTPMGVGSLAQAVIAHYRGHRLPTTVLGVEPDSAACVRDSLLAGRPVTVPTGETIMAGLNCGTVSSLAWPYLRDGLDAAVTVSDADAAAATAELGSGPCGAACVPAVRAALPALDLDRDATIVLLGTEARHGSDRPATPRRALRGAGAPAR